jgi:hypothetical protein
MFVMRQPRCLLRSIALPGMRGHGSLAHKLVITARQALAIEDGLGGDERDQLRALGVFERFAVDAIPRWSACLSSSPASSSMACARR